jgi:hypothetical protein
MSRSATPVTRDQPTTQTTTAHPDAPDTAAPKREPRLIWLILLIAAGVLITAAWGLALLSFAWSLLVVIL